MQLIGVLAVSKNNVIGRQGKIPWYYPEDFKFFKNLTLDSTVIMGKKTWESLPKKPLKNRYNIVVTNSPHNQEVFKDTYFTDLKNLDIVLSLSKMPHYLIGGESLFTQLNIYVNEYYITMVDEIVEDGDTFFPIEKLKKEFKVFNTIKLSDKCIVYHYKRN